MKVMFYIGQEVVFNYGAMFPTERGTIKAVKDETANKWIEDFVLYIETETGNTKRVWARNLMAKDELGIGCKVA